MALSYQGFGRLGVEQVILPTLSDMLARDVTVAQAIFELAYRTVDQHLRIAWSRLAYGRDSALMSTEGELWFYRRSFYAGR